MLMNEPSQHEEAMNEASIEANANVAVQSPFCGSLRSKNFFMMDELATEANQYLDHSGHCWCRETQQVVGPDGNKVQPLSCVPGRECYVSALES
ncbi:MAG: hypothetical protein NVSMB56_04290 [Pyrinomonadaceae bacterium]